TNATEGAENATEGAATNATEGAENATEGTRDQIKETVSGTQSAATNATEGAENATEGTQTPTEGPMEIGQNFLDQIWGQVTNLFK
ncbi:MAG: hypothetical protein ACRD8K_00670, partial [Nitrososphaeraceae archaeon]